MQKTKVNFDTVYEFETLYNAYRASRRGKRWKNTVAKVEMNALEAIAVLQEELSTGTYRPGGYREFYVFEPKKRLIQTNSFKDKIVQHAFCDTILYDVLTRPFILDNYGSQIGKGTHFGLNRLRDFMREYYRRHGSADGWVLKADVHHYFASIRHDILKQDVRELLDDERSLALTDLIIDSTPGNVGIPIGNQSSQVFALLYLNKLDHLMKEGFRFRYYGRYMDDFYIIHSDKLLLRQILKEIEAYIKPLGLRLNGKTQILPLKNGIDFLGFHTYLTQTGKVVRKVRAKSIDNMKRKIRKFRGLVDSGKMTLDSVVQSYASWTGHISHGNTYHLRQNMDAYFFSYFPELKPSPKGDTTHGPKTEQPRKQVEGQVRQPVRQPDRLDRGR